MATSVQVWHNSRWFVWRDSGSGPISKRVFAFKSGFIKIIVQKLLCVPIKDESVSIYEADNVGKDGSTFDFALIIIIQFFFSYFSLKSSLRQSSYWGCKYGPKHKNIKRYFNLCNTKSDCPGGGLHREHMWGQLVVQVAGGHLSPLNNIAVYRLHSPTLFSLCPAAFQPAHENGALNLGQTAPGVRRLSYSDCNIFGVDYSMCSATCITVTRFLFTSVLMCFDNDATLMENCYRVKLQ